MRVKRSQVQVGFAGQILPPLFLIFFKEPPLVKSVCVCGFFSYLSQRWMQLLQALN